MRLAELNNVLQNDGVPRNSSLVGSVIFNVLCHLMKPVATIGKLYLAAVHIECYRFYF